MIDVCSIEVTYLKKVYLDFSLYIDYLNICDICNYNIFCKLHSAAAVGKYNTNTRKVIVLQNTSVGKMGLSHFTSDPGFPYIILL